ncbi:MAG: hypothetical protein A2Y25_08950 [Candidatus Melainabacteria bacterium GWF2_37_15]|nr:MAG: hypothetical protein A2Y25_08950 [Candidatus Melainabacteria bacterium GWF2_37_15]
MRINYITNALGLILFYFGFIILVPIIVALIYEDYYSIIPFLSAAVISVSSGFFLRKIFKAPETYNDMKNREGLLIVVSAWTIGSIITAIPYLFYGLSPANALFEAISGVTTTGATILTDFSLYPKAFFFWRSMSQWLGGMGIIVLFIAILPQLAVAGRQMFFAEAPGPIEEKITPRIRSTAKALWGIYILLTFLEITFLMIAGMPAFDAICNSFSTLAAGGFSPHPESIMGYKSNYIDIIVTVFMFLAGANFVLQYKVISSGKFKLLSKDSEFKTYFNIVLISSLLLAFIISFLNGYSLFDGVRHGFFQIISIITTTGFASQDFEAWDTRAKVVIFAMMMIGGCAGSAGGGVKVVRILLGFKYMLREIAQTLHPKAVLQIKLDRTVVQHDVLKQILGFIIFYFTILILSTIVVSIIENDALIGISGTAATLGNIGPGFGALGPMSNFNSLSIVTKLIFCLDMLVGRLELIPFLVMLHPDFWHFYSVKKA